MGLLDAYQDSTDTALDVLAKLPPEAPKPAAKHSAWTTIPRAIGAAATEIAGGALDLAGAYGQVQAAYGADPFEPEKRKERLEIADRLQKEGIDWRTDESKGVYKFARDLRPDPQTAGAAENIVFGLTKGLTKAIGAGMVLGPYAGAAVFGGSEGATQSEDLAVQGVDFETRAKAGAVSAAINTAGMALPVAGQTLKQTAGLVIAGGPASFIAQQALTRDILENADYGKIAEQFDPLDPVGLTLATLLPAGFAAWAKGGQIKAALTKKPAKAADISPDIPKDIPAAKPDAIIPTQEQIDALMTHNLTAARDANLDAKAADDAVMAWQHEVETERAARAAAESEASVMPSGELEAAPSLADPNYRQAFEAMANETGWAEVGGRMIRNEDGSISRTAWVPNAEWWPGRPKGLSEAKAKEAIAKALAGEPLKAAEQRLVDYMLGYAKERVVPSLRVLDQMDEAERAAAFNDVMTAELDWHVRDIADADIVARAAKIDEAALEKAAVMHENDRAAFMKEAERIVYGHQASSENARTKADDSGQAHQPAPRPEATAPGKAGDAGQGGLDPNISSLLSRVEDLNARQPDMPVAMRDDGTPARLADELEAIRQDARLGTDDVLGSDDAPLLKVAAECFLSLGATA